MQDSNNVNTTKTKKYWGESWSNAFADKTLTNEVDISIVIPVYNMEQYLARCLDSVLAQTFPNYEVLIIDDGSVDGSKEIAKEYLRDMRFRYYYQKNSGVSAARNRGIDEAEGRWITFIDPDDYLYENYLAVLMEGVTHDADIVSCCCICDGSGEVIHFYNGNTVFQRGYTEGNIQDKSYLQYFDTPISKRDLLLELMNMQYSSATRRWTAIGVPWGKLYRRSLLNDNSLRFDTRLFRLQDNIFNMFSFDCCRDVVYIDRPLYVYNLDNITDYDRKYNPKAKVYFPLVSEIRYTFLHDHNLLCDPDIYREYCGEVLGNADGLLKKYFLHKDNRKSVRETVCEMRELFSREIFASIFQDTTAIKYCLKKRSISGKVRMYLLIKENYRLLLRFDRLIQMLRRVICFLRK